MSERISVDVDTEPAKAALAALENRIDAIVTKENTLIKTTERAAKMSFNRVLASSRLVWSALDQTLQALGINVGEQLRLLIQASFSSISTLSAIYSAQASNPFTMLFGLFSMMELGYALQAITELQSGERELSLQTARTSRAIFSIGSMLGSLSFM